MTICTVGGGAMNSWMAVLRAPARAAMLAGGSGGGPAARTQSQLLARMFSFTC